MIRQGYLPWLRGGEVVMAFEHQRGYFAEHSTPWRYVESNRALLDGAELSHPPDELSGIDQAADLGRDVVVREPVRIAAGAAIGDGATVGPHAVIGSCAQVAAGATVERAVVWPHARVTSDVRDAIVTPAAVVDVKPD